VRRVRALLALALSLLAVPAAGAPPAGAAVYWGSGGFVGAANLDGSNFVDGIPYGLANVPELGNVCGVAVAGGNLYWADPSRGTIGRTGLGFNPTGRVDFIKERVTIDEAFVSGLARPCGVAVDGSHVYWADTAGMAIGRADLDGGGVERNFIAGVSSPCGVGVGDGHVYWGNFVGGAVGRALPGGGEVEESFVEGATGPCGVAVDGAHVYWSNWDGTSIGRANLDGSASDNQFIGGLHNPCGVAVDDSHVYWTNWSARDPVGRADLDGGNVVPSLLTTDFYLASCGVALDARIFAPPPLPLSAPIFLGKMRRGLGKGVAYVNVKVPKTGGTVDVVSPALAWKFVGAPVADGGYWVWHLKIGPGKTGRAANKLRKRLARNGSATVTLEVTHTEPNHTPYTATRPLILVRHRPNQTRS
jgi:virginiamycin B lyase